MLSFKRFITEQENTVVWSDLKHVDLTKRNGERLQRFLQMVKDQAEFFTKKGVIKINKNEYERLSVEMPSKGYSTTIKAGLFNLKYPADFYKTPEFGGKGKGAGTAKEDYELNSLQKQIAAEKIRIGQQELNIKVGRTIYKVTDAESTPGTPKSDFHLIDATGKEVVWISHKVGSKPSDVQQWGGISDRKEPWIFSRPDTQKFIKDLKATWTDGLPPKHSYYRKIAEAEIKFKSVYGQNYGGKYGPQNVTLLLQGPVKLVKSGRQYTLGANHVHLNGESFDDTPYEAVFAAIHKPDRSDAGVKGTRIVIMSITGRKFKDGM